MVKDSGNFAYLQNRRRFVLEKDMGEIKQRINRNFKANTRRNRNSRKNKREKETKKRCVVYIYYQISK